MTDKIKKKTVFLFYLLFISIANLQANRGWDLDTEDDYDSSLEKYLNFDFSSFEIVSIVIGIIYLTYWFFKEGNFEFLNGTKGCISLFLIIPLIITAIAYILKLLNFIVLPIVLGYIIHQYISNKKDKSD
jgi:hypothetical protein